MRHVTNLDVLLLATLRYEIWASWDHWAIYTPAFIVLLTTILRQLRINTRDCTPSLRSTQMSAMFDVPSSGTKVSLLYRHFKEICDWHNFQNTVGAKAQK